MEIFIYTYSTFFISTNAIHPRSNSNFLLYSERFYSQNLVGKYPSFEAWETSPQIFPFH